jgi:hypothetical protein
VKLGYALIKFGCEVKCVMYQVHVHGRNLASLHTIVAPELLPREYGGTNGTLQDLIGEWTQEGKIMCKNCVSQLTFHR